MGGPINQPQNRYFYGLLLCDQTLIDVWRQVLVENAAVVLLGIGCYPVQLTPKRHLREVDFVFDGNEIRRLEQNPDTKSRWAERFFN